VQLEPGDTFGPYVVEDCAGSGGMGEVYRARDTRLDRLVALKVIGTRGGDQPEIRKRFADEARAIAALNHPHICALYDTGRHEGRDFLVLEYLEGETLAHRLRRGPLSLSDVLAVAIDIADALDYAHRRGVVHRDLKPSNVLLTRSHGAKLLDFGLATLRATASRADSQSGLATVPLDLTKQGVVVGTLHYLAPERLDGREADARSDVFAFGAMFYEMLTNRKAFDEKNEARLIAAILSSEPTPIDPAAGVPSECLWVAQNCLAKDPDGRWQSMGDVAKVLRGIVRTQPAVASPAPRGRLALWIGAAALAGAAVAAGALTLRDAPRARGSAIEGPVTLSVLPPVGGFFALTDSTVKSAQFAMAPDGQALVFVGTVRGVRQLWIRELRAEPRLLAGTSGASYPFWAPDGQFIGFFADGYLKKVSVNGRSPQPLCKAVTGRGGAWGDDGTIVFAADTTTALSKVSEAGGNPEPVTTLGPAHLAHRWPQFLEDGRILFFVRSAEPDVQGIYATSLENPGEVHRILPSAKSGIYSSGQLLFVLDGELRAQPFNPTTLQLSGEALPVGLKVDASSAMNSAVSASNRGTLATWTSGGGLSELVWFDRRGTRLGKAGSADRYFDFRLAPNERRLVLSRVDPAANTADLAIYDLGAESLTPLISSSQTDGTAVWSADGERLVFRSNRRGVHELFIRPAHGGGDEKLLHSTGFGMYPTDWSSDGASIVFHMLDPSTKHDIWTFDVAKGSAVPLVRTAADEAQGQLTSTGLLAYTSNQSGELEVYVRRLDGTSGSLNVSANGGFDPRWRGDGRELFFVSPEGMLMAVEISTEGSVHAGPRRSLFPTTIQEASGPYLSDYVVSKDGGRFLIKVPTEPPGSGPITVTLNWPERLGGNAR
jgi:Tol biopolymer transport system component